LGPSRIVLQMIALYTIFLLNYFTQLIVEVRLQANEK
jgi:hypothetical protein